MVTTFPWISTVHREWGVPPGHARARSSTSGRCRITINMPRVHPRAGVVMHPATRHRHWATQALIWISRQRATFFRWTAPDILR